MQKESPPKINTIVYDSCEYLQWYNFNGQLSGEPHIIHKDNYKKNHK